VEVVPFQIDAERRKWGGRARGFERKADARQTDDPQNDVTVFLSYLYSFHE
jgi:hypothetical protein